jgi:hypothetical protein
MKILDKLELRFRRYAVPNVTVALIICQVLVYVAQLTHKGILGKVVLVPELVLKGEVWRLVSFLFQPPLMNPLFAFFFWYLFYLMGSALEHTWGTFRYNLFLLVGYVATVAAAFVTPDQPTFNVFLQGSVFLAFAFLYPDFQLLLFFLIPVKVKWLALLQWIGYFYALVFVPSWPVRLATLAAISNFLLFFWGDLVLRIRSGYRRMSQQAQEVRQRDVPRHQCRICGRTEKTDPEMSFRYCSKCSGSCCYCEEHLRDHEHVTADAEAGKDRPES